VLPAYPEAGFGRAGCYDGRGLQRMYAADADTGSRRGRGPWLVLDSITGGEMRRAGAPDSIPLTAVARPASLLEIRDSLEWTHGIWFRPSADSIAMDEGSVFPPAYWRFQVTPDGLRGEGVLGHDVILTRPDGRIERPVSRWMVHARSVPCSEVPVVKDQ